MNPNLQFKVPNAWWKKFQIKNPDTFQLWSLVLYQCAKRIHVSVELRNVLCTSLNSKLEQNSSKGKIISETHCSKSSYFVQKFDYDFPRKLSIFIGWKTRESVVVLDFLAVDNFGFTRKIVDFFWRKTRENVGVLPKLNF